MVTIATIPYWYIPDIERLHESPLPRSPSPEILKNAQVGRFRLIYSL